MADPLLCTESVDETLTLGTFRLFITRPGGSEQEIGNIETGGFQYTPNIFEHRRGLDNSLDAQIALGRDYAINFTTDSISTYNLSVLLNEETVNGVDECIIPLTGSRCVINYGVRLLHFFPCGDKTLEIEFWRASILSEFEMNFERENPATIQGVIKSLNCESQHPTEPYGRITITEACPSS